MFLNMSRFGIRISSFFLSSTLIILLAAGFASLPTAKAQQGLFIQKTWGLTNQYGSSDVIGRRVALDSSGNLYVTGITSPPGGYSVFLLKYDPVGNLLWAKLWSQSDNNTLLLASSVAVDSLGNIYVTVQFGGYGSVLLKFDPSGSLMWQKTWDTTYPGNGGAAAVAVDSSGRIDVAGETGKYGNGGYDVFLTQFNASGSRIWSKTWGGSGYECVSCWTSSLGIFGSGIAVDSLGNIYVSGYTDSFGSAGVFLLKFDSSGGLLYQKKWDGGGIGRGVAVDSSGNVYVTGSVGGNAASSVFLLKADSKSELVWQRTWGGSGSADGSAVAVDSAGNVYVTGCSGTDLYCTNGYRSKILLLKFDSAGTLIFQQTIGGSNSALGSGLALDSSGNPVVVGVVSEAPPYTVNSTTNKTLGTPTFQLSKIIGNNLGTPAFILADAAGKTTAVTGSVSYAGGLDAVLLKYGLLPQVTFHTNPSTGGSITFNGVAYVNGQNGNFSYDTFTISAHPPQATSSAAGARRAESQLPVLAPILQQHQ